MESEKTATCNKLSFWNYAIRIKGRKFIRAQRSCYGKLSWSLMWFSCLVYDLTVERNNEIGSFFCSSYLDSLFWQEIVKHWEIAKLILMCWKAKSATSHIYVCASVWDVTLRAYGLRSSPLGAVPVFYMNQSGADPSWRRLRILSLTTWMMLFTILPFHFSHRDSPHILVSGTVSLPTGMGWMCLSPLKKTHMLMSKHPIPQDMTVFGYRLFKERVILK